MNTPLCSAPFRPARTLTDKSTFVLPNLAVLSHLSLVKHPGPNHEFAIRSSHLPILLPPIFLPLFHLWRVHRLLSVFCSGGMSLAKSPGIPTFTCKPNEPPPWQTNALSSSPSSSTSSVVGRIFCGADPSARICTRWLYVRNDFFCGRLYRLW